MLHGLPWGSRNCSAPGCQVRMAGVSLRVQLPSANSYTLSNIGLDNYLKKSSILLLGLGALRLQQPTSPSPVEFVCVAGLQTAPPVTCTPSLVKEIS